jgi:hypothetical protein
MSAVPTCEARDWRAPSASGVAEISRSRFVQLTREDIRDAFAAPAPGFPPILSLTEAAGLVKLRPQTLKRKVSEGAYAASVVRGKPLRFWRDRLVLEVMR